MNEFSHTNAIAQRRARKNERKMRQGEQQICGNLEVFGTQR